MPTEREFTRHDARGMEGLHLAIVLAAIPDGRVDLKLRPEIFADMVLGRRIAGDGGVNGGSGASRRDASEVSDEIELSEAFTRLGRIDAGVGRPILVAAHRQNDSVQEVVAVLLVG